MQAKTNIKYTSRFVLFFSLAFYHSAVWKVSSRTEFFLFSYYCCNSLHYSSDSPASTLSTVGSTPPIFGWFAQVYLCQSREIKSYPRFFISFHFDVCRALLSELLLALSFPKHIFMDNNVSKSRTTTNKFRTLSDETMKRMWHDGKRICTMKNVSKTNCSKNFMHRAHNKITNDWGRRHTHTHKLTHRNPMERLKCKHVRESYLFRVANMQSVY